MSREDSPKVIKDTVIRQKKIIFDVDAPYA